MTHASFLRIKLAAIIMIFVNLLEAMMVRVPAYLISDLPKPISETIKTALKVHGAKMANQINTANVMRCAYHVVMDRPANLTLSLTMMKNVLQILTSYAKQKKIAVVVIMLVPTKNASAT